MAIYYARKSGNINATDIWATTPTGTASDVFSSFTNQDILMANAFSITVNVNVTVAEIRNDSANSATSGGVFVLTNGVTVTANIYGAGAGPTSAMSCAGSVSATIVGSIYGNSGVASNFVSTVGNGGTGTLTITGNLFSGDKQLGYAVVNTSSGTVIITGNLLAGPVASPSTNYIVGNTGTGTVIIIGNVTAGSFNMTLALNSSIGSMTINGSISGGTGTSAIGALNSNAGTLTINGSVTGGTVSTALGASNSSAGTLIINGSVTGGTSAIGASNTGTGTLTVNGTATGNVAAGVSASSTGTVSVTRAKGGASANSAVGVTNGTTGSTLSVDEIEYGDLGASPTSGPIIMNNKTSNIALIYIPSLAKKTLIDTASTTLLPASSNVRSGIVYNAGQTTGTMIVPPAASVSLGVSVDNTTGTAFINPADFWDYATSLATLSGSMGERLKNCSTIASVGQQLSDSLSN